MSWDYYRPGQIIDNIRILEQLTSGNQSETRYRVLNECCGREDERTHLAIKRKFLYAAGSKCTKCTGTENSRKAASTKAATRRKKSVKYSGHVEGAALTVLSARVDEKNKIDLQRYDVCYDCCGAKRTMTHRAIRQRIVAGTLSCQRCTSRLRSERNGKPKPKPRVRKLPELTPYGVVLPTWPVPGYVAINRHIVWGDRMQ